MHDTFVRQKLDYLIPITCKGKPVLDLVTRAVWPDVGEKSNQIFYKSCPKSIHISLM